MRRVLLEGLMFALGVLSIATPAIAGIPMNPRMQTFIYGNSATIQAKEAYTLSRPQEEWGNCYVMDSVLNEHFKSYIIHPKPTYEERRNAVATWIVEAKYDDKACGNSYSRTKLAGFFQSGLIDRFLTGEAVFIFRDENLSPKSTQRQKAFEF